MRKRERENPCEICGHYHNSEEGERCGVCGHRSGPMAGEPPATLDPAFPTEVLKDFLFLGSYNNASRSEVLKTLSITHILNTVPDCQNLYRNSFTYHCIQDERSLDFDGANRFLEQCERETSRVLVHCMSGKNRCDSSVVSIHVVSIVVNDRLILLWYKISRSAAIVIGYLMKSRGWRLSQSYQWVKDRRPQVQLTDASQNQLVEYEQKLFGPNVGAPAQSSVPTESFRPLGFGFPKPAGDIQAPVFNQQPVPSIFERVNPSNIPSNFTFGAMEANTPMDDNGAPAPTSGDNPMDSS
uniref:Tyrosine-protein phosphatase domain-containing protein n=1 Tax=Oryza rufipogon TaxID=4529 RepID=A0A0E0NK82_ORYRU